MSFSITKAAEELREDTSWQRTPEVLDAGDYERLIVRGIRRLLIDTGRALTYDETMFFTAPADQGQSQSDEETTDQTDENTVDQTGEDDTEPTGEDVAQNDEENEEPTEEENETESAGEKMFDMNFMIDEIAYIMLCARIDFFKRVQTDVNNIVGYTTNALSVTNADKPYAHLQDTISDLENERRILFFKMTRYALVHPVESL